MPIIAIAPCSKLPDYEESVRRSGGEVRALNSASDAPADVIASIDGLLLAGGGDVRPDLYGAVAHPTFDPAEPGRDDYEMELVRLAFEKDLPVFAICRGVQLLNVARGGTLIQDIPDEVGTSVEHRIKEPRFAIAHDVWLTPGSLLERTLRERLEDADSCAVNSRHHQAPKDLGEGLVASATAPDGVVEAIEDPNHRFVLGVQWHPENFWRTGEFRTLFEAFVQACGG
ncbi:MAG TPA: gamma-glutamyl-gamma-aminobutyrate hydrolase family protein [Vicinamibacterales bacterium]